MYYPVIIKEKELIIIITKKIQKTCNNYFPQNSLLYKACTGKPEDEILKNGA